MTEITLILHNIRSTHNVGSIFRTAEGFGVKKIILSGYTPYPAHVKDTRLPHLADKITSQIHKTALGAETMVAFEQYDNLLTWLDTNTLPLVALEQAPTSSSVRDFSPPNKFALLLGEEVAGVDTGLLDRCDHIVEIPMQGKKESFNVSVAAGIALYQLSAA
ncbi:TPA: TrmH family RNA methyltransferase [Candidatus Saccharibacteria bacterium]|nr:TrmH family RNA methyltransferase [Candidatus Saccharibacteria bacterium]